MVKRILLVVFTLFQVLKANKPQSNLCVRANQNCRDDALMCGFAYARFEAACDISVKPISTMQNRTHVKQPKPKPCSEECLEAINILNSTKRGRELHDCDCQLDGHCLIVKARVEQCLNSAAIDARRQSCTLALWNCTRDPTCKFLKTKFLNDCREMFNGVKCEKKCQKIQNRLFRSTYGQPLAKCECDGASEAYCRAIRGHAIQLRCLPGQDGAGTPVFTYIETDPGIIHGATKEEPSSGNNTANFLATRSFLVFILNLLTLFLLS